MKILTPIMVLALFCSQFAMASTLTLAPSAKLHYNIKAKQKGIPVSGEADAHWQVDTANNRYSIVTETRVMIFGKILDASSTGSMDEQGLVPDKYAEKRYGKAENIAYFDRNKKIIHFSVADQTYPIKGGEQDRTSATWQLSTLAKANPSHFKPDSVWKLFVAGRRDAEMWVFKVVGTEKTITPLGEFTTLHFVKAPPPDSTDQQLDIWIATDLEFYPVRIKFSDADGDHVDQLLSSIKK